MEIGNSACPGLHKFLGAVSSEHNLYEERDSWQMFLPLQITVNPVVKGVGGLFSKQDVVGPACERLSSRVGELEQVETVCFAPFPTQTRDPQRGAIPQSITQQIPC